ncbi:integral membrane protein [Lactiplantibacillus fabifermentans DSM 21115]|nr:integral membrane protein [Lactiplantibacillus fabifermentans DSM 21115]
MMSTYHFHLQTTRLSTAEMWQGLLIALVLYLVGILAIYVNRMLGFYVLGLVLIIYSLGLISALMSGYQSDAAMEIKLALEVIVAIGLVLNFYTLVLLTRERHQTK